MSAEKANQTDPQTALEARLCGVSGSCGTEIFPKVGWMGVERARAPSGDRAGPWEAAPALGRRGTRGCLEAQGWAWEGWWEALVVVAALWGEAVLGGNVKHFRVG